MYADHFRDAAHYLSVKTKNSTNYSDLDACSIAFLYRHALELYFKSIILIGADIFNLRRVSLIKLQKFIDSNCKKNIFSTHTLGILFPYARYTLDKIFGPWPKENNIPTMNEVNQMMSDLDRFDKKSFGFRYPLNKDGTISESRKLMFNIIDFSSKMHNLCEFLGSCYSGLFDIFQNCCEGSYDHQS